MINLSEIKEKINKNGKYWIVFTGDSITSCEWVHPNWREMVEYVLQEEMTEVLGDWKKSEWGIRGFNFALDGATTRDILELQVDRINLIKPDMVIGVMGGNDPTLGVKVEETKNNLENIFDRWGDETQIVWCNSTSAGKGNRKNEEYKPYAEVLNNLKDRPNLQKIDMFNIYAKFPTEKFFTFISEENPVEGIKAGEIDQQHPNQLGNAYIAKVILKEVWSIEFDPEKYMESTRRGDKLPVY